MVYTEAGRRPTGRREKRNVNARFMQGVRSPREEQALAILAAALHAAGPGDALRLQVRRDGDTLHVAERAYDLTRYQRIYVAGGGKAAVPMVAALEGILGDRITAGVVNARREPPDPGREPERGERTDQDAPALAPDSGSKVVVNLAGHPIPDAAGHQDSAAGDQRGRMQRRTTRAVMTFWSDAGRVTPRPAAAAS